MAESTPGAWNIWNKSGISYARKLEFYLAKKTQEPTQKGFHWPNWNNENIDKNNTRSGLKHWVS